MTYTIKIIMISVKLNIIRNLKKKSRPLKKLSVGIKVEAAVT